MKIHYGALRGGRDGTTTVKFIGVAGWGSPPTEHELGGSTDLDITIAGPLTPWTPWTPQTPRIPRTPRTPRTPPDPPDPPVLTPLISVKKAPCAKERE
jgi:hypothetical protein